MSSGLILLNLFHTPPAKENFLAQKSDHVSPSKSGPWPSSLGLTSCPPTPSIFQPRRRTCSHWHLSSLSCYWLWPLFKFHFPSSLPLLTYTLVFLPHSRQHANILSWKDFFPLTQEASFGLNVYCHYFYGLPTTWYWNCWIMDLILWTSHTFLEVTVSISISLELHSMCWAYGRTFIWSA